MKNGKKIPLRAVYALLAAAVLIIEIFIGVFVRDNFIRPFVGDVLVVVLIAFVARVILPEKPKMLPLYCTAFAFFVELIQLADIVGVLGIEKSSLIGIIIGSTFDWHDLVCYAVGGALAAGADAVLRKRIES